MYTWRKRAHPPPNLVPPPAPTLAPVPAPEQAPEAAPEPPMKKLLRRSQARKRTYLPIADGFLAFNDEESDDEVPSIFEIRESSQSSPDIPLPTEHGPLMVRHTLHSVRDMVRRHHSQLRALRERTQELEDDLYIGGGARGALLCTIANLTTRMHEAEQQREDSKRRVAVLEQHLEDLE